MINISGGISPFPSFDSIVANAVIMRIATENIAPYFNIAFPFGLASFVLSCEECFCCSI